MTLDQRKRTLYLTRNGLLEPLGQSQVLAYLRGLSKTFDITVISYEKADDWADAKRVRSMKAECERLGIRWMPQRFLTGLRLITPAMSMVRMTWLVITQVHRHDIQLIHARSYIPAIVCLVVKRLMGVPFIFDMRALWPEELITAKRLTRGSLLHRMLIAAERACLKSASAVVSLTHAAVSHLLKAYPAQVGGQRIVVIPTCVDLARFTPAQRRPEQRVIGCLGTLLSGWFKIDWLTTFLSEGTLRDPSLRVEITTRDDPLLVRQAVNRGLERSMSLCIAPSSPEAVPDVLRGQFCSVMFYAGGEVSELGRSPTRMAEILACGLPVVANEGVGDVAEIVRAHRVGVLVHGIAREQACAAWDELEQLLQDRTLADRCRRTAESLFSLDAGTAAYQALYTELLDNRASLDRGAIAS